MLPQFITRTAPKSWEGCMPLSDDERLAEFKFKWYAAGLHHREPDDQTEQEGVNQ